MGDQQHARRRPSLDSFLLFKAALQQISTAAGSELVRQSPNEELKPSVSSYSRSSIDGLLEGEPSTNPSQASPDVSIDMEPSSSPHAVCWELPNFPSSFPSYKRIPGLTPLWNRGIIFCSHITARLVVECIKVPKFFVCPLPMGDPVDVDSCVVTLVDANHCPGAVQFLFQVPAEKSGIFLRYVHTGDMRYSSDMKVDPSLCDFIGADAVFLDTTYCNPKFIFPTQSESLSYIADTIFTMREESNEKLDSLIHVYDDIEELDEVFMEGGELNKNVVGAVDTKNLDSNGLEMSSKGNADVDIEEDGKPDDASSNTANSMPIVQSQQRQGGSTLFLISTYVIGKEKILSAVAKRCKCLIYTNERKLGILKCLDLENVDIFTTSPSATNVHVVSWNFLGETWPFFRPNFRKMEELLKKSGYDRVVGFVPTGWTYEIKKKTFSVRRKGPLEIHLVPYSEHSNYQELREYVAFLRPHEIFPTVGLEGGDMDSKAVAAMRKHFRNLVDETASKRRFLKGFSRKSGTERVTPQAKKLKSQSMGSELHKSELTSGDGQAYVCEDMTDSRTGFEEIPDNLNLTDTKEFPKAAFGRGAKKRQRVSCKSGEFDVSDPVVAKKEIVQAERGSSPAVCQISSEVHLETTEETGNSIISQKKKEQLRTVLPRIANEKQVNDLLLKANGDLDLAVALYFEGTQVDQQEQASDKNGRPASIEENDFVVSAGMQAGVLEREDLQKKSSPITKTMSSLAAKRSRGSQASILTFFKKSNLSANSSVGPDNSSSWQIEHAESQKTGQKKEMLSLKSPIKMAGLDQIIAILGDCVSLDKAQTLLQQSCGDINAALDLYYKESCSDLPKRNIEDETLSESNDNLGQDDKEQECRVVAVEAKNDFVATSIWDYRPIEYACWKRGEPAPYIHLARTFDLVEQESRRLRTSDMLCNMFRSLLVLSPDAVLPAVYLSTNRIAPDYENTDLNIGGSTVSAAIIEATGTQKSKIKEMYNATGDLGDVAQACRQTQSLLVAPRILSIQQVYLTLLQISKETGSGSSSRKKGLILGLLRACREKETKYIVRTLVQNMRIGAMMRSVLPALAQAIVFHTSLTTSKQKQIKNELLKASSGIMEAYNFMPNLNILVPALLQDGVQTVLNKVAVSPGIPVKPMLAKITNGITEVFKRFQGKPFTCEYKYDGQRAQVHLLKDGTIRIFSRNCEDTTSRFPDVLDIVRMAVRPGIQDLIFDAEIVAVDRENNNKLMAFQHLSTRERGRSGATVSLENIKVDVCLFVFDLMYANGEPLVKAIFAERRKRMQECFEDGQAGCFGFTNQITIEGEEADGENLAAITQVENFLEEAINSSCEGIMVKTLDSESAYAPSKRSDSWLKVKRDYIEGLHDTLDLVPIGAWHGNGRKAGWFSPFLLACYDADREEYQSVCRVMSGFTDVFYKQMKAFFADERLLQRKPTYYQTLEEPNVWFSPELVWEIRGADLTVSPVHQAAVGLVHPSRGISLRFPRFIKERLDKRPEDSNTPSDIADLFQQQSRKLEIPAQRSESPQKG
ncbi:hypothetical protein GOP47_0028342 [Adiantum capillus-veneris]|nr:hypothetical protein GOP47_0028342 [Adiantum capillus-veneris]